MVTTAVSPASQGLRGRERYTVLAVTVCVALLTAFAGWLFAFGLDYSTTETATRNQKRADDKVDREDPPFTTTARYQRDPDYASEGVVLLDRPLTPAEQQRLTAVTLRPGVPNPEYLALLRSLGGRMVHPPSASVDGEATGLHLDIFSDRKAGLTIVGMRADIVECHPPRARAIIEFPTQGGGYYKGLVFDLANPANPPVIGDDDDEHWGEPFFTHNKIDLGNGATPGGLVVEAAASGRSCSWQIGADYGDSEGLHKKTIRNGKAPFVAEAVPELPEQRFRYDLSARPSGRFVACGNRHRGAPC